MATCILSKPACPPTPTPPVHQLPGVACPWVPNKTWVVWGLREPNTDFFPTSCFGLTSRLFYVNKRQPSAAVRFACLQESDKCKQKLQRAANIFRGQTETPQTDEWQNAALCWVLVRFFKLIVHPVFVFIFSLCVCVHNASVVTLHNTASGNNVCQRVCSMGK